MTKMGIPQFTGWRAMRAVCMGLLLLLAVMPSSAQAQPARPAHADFVGPLTPAQVKTQEQADQQAAAQEKLRQLAEQAGYPIGSAAAAATQRGDILMPDLSRMIPTSAEPQKLSTSLTIVLLMSLLTLAPSILLMTTCFTRIIIVMSLLRQAMGAAQLPPNQVLIGLSLFMTFLVMAPTWNKINEVAIKPYNDPNGRMTQAQALNNASGVLREFMMVQIKRAHNEDDVLLFYRFANRDKPEPKTWKDVDTMTIIPGYILSELKVAFLIGFRIYLPFLIIDMVISSVLISVGMQLLPPVMVSLPFKLLLFVLVDGWSLVAGMLMRSFG
jgi:flagellar biosynthetic protein FliP